MHCSLTMHGFHNGKWLILCSNSFYFMLCQSYLLSTVEPCFHSATFYSMFFNFWDFKSGTPIEIRLCYFNNFNHPQRG